MYLEKGNTKIYYEVRGEGEALILIHGVITDSSLYEQASLILSDYFKVVTFDRRGNSRSKGPAGEEQNSDVKYMEFSLEEQTDDIRDIMDELGIKQAYIAGASGGAVIGHNFLCKYPERVKHLIMYEAAMLGHMLKTDSEFKEWAEKTASLVNAGKLNSALLRFAAHIGPKDDRSPVKPFEDSIRELGNLEYAMKSEIPGLLEYDPDPEMLLEHADRITVAAGEKSGDSAYVQESRRLAEIMGKRVLFYPGGHNLPYDLPQEFAVCILGTIIMSDSNKWRIRHSE